jgi:phage baseplate assembly protein V
MIRFGYISEIDPATGKARVTFREDDGLVTKPLPIIFPATTGDEYFVLPDLNTQVAVLMANADDGVILGAIYNSEKKPSQGAADKTYIKFKDGTLIVYDRAAHKYSITMDTVTFEISRDGFAVKRGDETLKKLLSDLLDKIVAQTHTTPSGVSGPPINAADFTAIKNRLPNLLTQ